ncbi:MAG TPA: hypothetical protein VM733_14085 [Thermoanaerobaculia bacterium]|nr:hypothetical protein [Thermoanaerobaculia bacterium]
MRLRTTITKKTSRLTLSFGNLRTPLSAWPAVTAFSPPISGDAADRNEHEPANALTQYVLEGMGAGADRYFSHP